MAIETLLKGASVNKRLAFTTTTTDELGNEIETPIPHVGIVHVKVILTMLGNILHKFSTDATDISNEWAAMITEPEEGEYSFALTPTETAILPVGIMTAETIRTYVAIPENETIVTSRKLYNVVSTLHQTTV